MVGSSSGGFKIFEQYLRVETLERKMVSSAKDLYADDLFMRAQIDGHIIVQIHS